MTVDVLKRFCISVEYGFLLESPDRHLPEKYLPWEDLAERVPELVGTAELDAEVQALPLLEVDELRTHRQLRLAHLQLCTLSAAFLWSDPEKPKLFLPRPIAVPFFEVSRRLGIPPVPSHGTICLANWRLIDDTEWKAENLDIIAFRFLRDRGNAWFFVNTAQIEKDLAPAICAVADVVAKAATSEKISEEEFVFCMKAITKGLREAGGTLLEMKKHLRPEVFYHGFRQFLNGYTEGAFSKQGGLIFQGLEHLGPMPIGGASAAQSSTIQTFDAFLKIVHDEKPSDFLLSQRGFMPAPHREFIEWVQENSPEDVRSAPGYAEVVEELHRFRSLHIRIGRIGGVSMSTPKENDASAAVASSTNGERRSKKPSSRPSMQIYRPPGLRSSDENQQAKPLSAAGPKQPKKNPNEPLEENNNDNNERSVFSERAENSSSPLSTSSASSPNGSARETLKRNDSSVSNSSQRSQHRASPPVMTAKTLVGAGASRGHKKEHTPLRPANQQKKKSFGPKEVEEIVLGFKQLNFVKEAANIDLFLAGNLENTDLARSIAQALVQFAIEESRMNGKNVARLSAQVMDSPAGKVFHMGLVTSVTQYFDCRSQLRVDHFRVWIAFLNFVSDLYANLGFTYQGELVNVVFQIFDYMLKPPILDSLKIEELECLIGALLSVGYDLERHCPDQLGVLKELIRDALIEVHEPWARKMILLLMELSASGWKLSSDANDYYFA
ncbi:hypothetical protein QR680_005539 [Steinernema hermaphroditum]|uniref:MIF4G domain-containing protein n=1 Tax=Steinernema hermaphroditum TaxID=289476 RepID=A0AA39HSE1_9BILA|nr:hypothetical protein QR680_005539 [Steinernema hermaphroditum]